MLYRRPSSGCTSAVATVVQVFRTDKTNKSQVQLSPRLLRPTGASSSKISAHFRLTTGPQSGFSEGCCPESGQRGLCSWLCVLAAARLSWRTTLQTTREKTPLQPAASPDGRADSVYGPVNEHDQSQVNRKAVAFGDCVSLVARLPGLSFKHQNPDRDVSFAEPRAPNAGLDLTHPSAPSVPAVTDRQSRRGRGRLHLHRCALIGEWARQTACTRSWGRHNGSTVTCSGSRVLLFHPQIPRIQCTA